MFSQILSIIIGCIQMLMHLVSIFMEEDLLPGEKFQFTLNVQLEASQFDFSNVSPEDLCIIEWTIIS